MLYIASILQFIINQDTQRTHHMRNVLRIFVLTYLINISFCDFIAGQSLIKGHVIDATSGEPLIGASVILKDDPTKGTVTDFDGTFELRSESFPVFYMFLT
jgi:hypothetical protein